MRATEPVSLASPAIADLAVVRATYSKVPFAKPEAAYDHPCPDGARHALSQPGVPRAVFVGMRLAVGENG